MGAVYDAVDTALDRHVALKLIAPELADDAEFRARFAQEAQAQASLDSPHVVQVFAHGEIGGRLYIASQLVPDGDLGAALRRHGPLPPQEAAALFAQVADGLAEAHRVGLAHRDITAANVLLRRRGTHTVAYLSDFGIAVRARGDAAADDVRALVRLLRRAVDGRPGDRLARVLDEPPVSAADLRDALRDVVVTGPAGRRPGAGRAAVAGAALLAAVLAVVVVPGSRPEGRTEEAGPVAKLARGLERSAGLDRETARCTARALVVSHGAARLREVAVDDALRAAAGCLWAPRPVSRR